MSKNLEKVIQRAISDAAFRRQLQTNPDTALRGFNLTADEVTALRSGDANKLMSLGIDQRMSKTFSVGADAAIGTASVMVPASDVGSGSASVGDPNFTVGAPGDVAIDPGSVESSTSTPYGAYPEHGGLAGPSGVAPTSDALEDQSHAFAASRSADVEGSTTGRSFVHDMEPPPYTGGLVAPVEGSPESFAFTDTAAPTSDALEDQSHAFVASRSADVAGSTTGRSFVHDMEPPPYSETPAADALEDQSHAFAASRSADVEGSTTGRSFVHDMEPPPYSETASSVAPTSDALEDQSHEIAARQHDAFLTQSEAAQYATDEGMVTDTAGQSVPTPDVEITVDGTGIDSAANQEPEISS